MTSLTTSYEPTPENTPDSDVQNSPERTEAAYRIESLEPNLHLYLITITLRNSAKENTIDLILPAWRPGRYQIQNYAANVQEFSASGAKGNLRFQKIDKQTWRVTAGGERDIKIVYKYYAGAQLDAGNCYVSRDEMYFNGSNLFMYTAASRTKRVSLYINYPNGWNVATQLTPTSDPRHFMADTYDDLIDSPTLVSPTLVEFHTMVKGAKIRFCFQNSDGLGQGKFNEKQIMKDMGRLVEQQFELMMDVPFKEYVFIYHIVQYPYSHGVEHKFSTSIVLGPASTMDQRYNSFLSISSHEFFHVWNIKRIIPREYVPYDYTREGYSPMLYVSEGFTSYYGDLTLARSKVWSGRDYIRNLGSEISQMQNTYGRKVQPVTLSSFDAWLSGYGSGRANSTVSFYSKGELIGLLLDLIIRHETKNKRSLDDVMRQLNERFGKTGRGFSASDFESTCEKIAGKSLSDFFSRYVYGTDELPYEEILGYAGLEVMSYQDDLPYLGAGFLANSEFPTVSSITPESPAFHAGLDQGDVLLAAGEISLQKESVPQILSKHFSGKGDTAITLTFMRGKKLMTASLSVEGQRRYSVSKTDTPTPLQKDILESWLNTAWNEL